MELFDTHCHLDDKIYKNDLENCIKKASENSVNFLMAVGTDEKSSFDVVKISEKYKNIYASVGIHPHSAKDCTDDLIEKLKQLTKKSSVKAWGEIGLDFNRMFSKKSVQEKWFIKQLKVADDLKLPIIFHERDSKSRLLDILKDNTKDKRNGVIHCFSGSLDEAREYIDLGLYIGITGILTIQKRGRTLRQIVKKIPINKIVIETDAPYLTPAPQKNKTRRNEPAFVRSVFLKLSEILEIKQKILAQQILKNSCKLFKIENT